MKRTITTLLSLILMSKSTLAQTILINEIHPNPKGADQGKEWIEIFNPGSNNLNLENYQINLNNKTKRVFEKMILESNALLTIDLSPLPNSKATIKILSPEGKTLDQTYYEKAPTGQSFSRINNQFIWTTPTRNHFNPSPQIYQGTLIELLEKIRISKSKNPQILKLIAKKQLQILTLDRNFIKARIIKASPP